MAMCAPVGVATEETRGHGDQKRLADGFPPLKTNSIPMPWDWRRSSCGRLSKHGQDLLAHRHFW
jgi:hypothetical protein